MSCPVRITRVTRRCFFKNYDAFLLACPLCVIVRCWVLYLRFGSMFLFKLSNYLAKEENAGCL